MGIVGGLGVHRAQITFDWVDTDTGECARGRIAPADRAEVRRWLEQFQGRDSIVRTEATAGWRRDLALGPLRGGSTSLALILPVPWPASRGGSAMVAAMALAGALSMTIHAVTGVRNRSLRALVAGLLGASYTASQMTYDFRRLRLHGLIERIAGTHAYALTSDDVRVALFFTKVHDRLLPPLLAADRPPAPPELRAALKTIEQAVADRIADARITKAAARNLTPAWNPATCAPDGTCSNVGDATIEVLRFSYTASGA